mmetsp:Transcript_14289/g.38517  ORF Transcript_14289/g.38517 Transcript_14289/m.38517 type:complete len:1312 (-) Transcript_14289:446-4381(-)
MCQTGATTGADASSWAGSSPSEAGSSARGSGHGAEQRTLHFDVWMRVVKARNLPAKGFIGSTDAYARCLWGHRTGPQPKGSDSTPMICFQTDLRKRSLNPRWDFERSFLYRASAAALREQSLVVQVFHRSPLLGDEPIGSARVSLYDVATAPTLFDLPLADSFGKPTGRVSLNIRMQQLCSLGVSLPNVSVDLSRAVGLDGKFYTSVEVHTCSSEFAQGERLHATVEPAEFHREMTRRRGNTGKGVLEAGEFEESADREVRLSTTSSNFVADSLHIRVWCVRDPCRAPSTDSASAGVLNPLMMGECWLAFAKVYTPAVGLQTHVSAASFREPLWALGQRTGVITGMVRIDNGPQLLQLEHGFFTERGVMPASPMVLSCDDLASAQSPWIEPPVVLAHCVSSLPRLPCGLVAFRSPSADLPLPPESRQLHMLVQALMKAHMDEATAHKFDPAHGGLGAQHSLSGRNRTHSMDPVETRRALALGAGAGPGVVGTGGASAAAADVPAPGSHGVSHALEAHMPANVPGADGLDADTPVPSPVPSPGPASPIRLRPITPSSASEPVFGSSSQQHLAASPGGNAGGPSPVLPRRLHRTASMPKQLGLRRSRYPSAGVVSPHRSSSAGALDDRGEDPLPRKVGIYLTRIWQLLSKSHKKSSVSFVYRDQGALLWTQQLLLKLWSYLLQHVDSVPHAVQQLHFQIIYQVMTRGELDVGGCVDCGNTNGHSTSYAEFVTWYRRVLLDTVYYVVTKLNRRAVSNEVRVFCAQVLAIAYFRLPEFREVLLSSLLPPEEKGAHVASWDVCGEFTALPGICSGRLHAAALAAQRSQPTSPCGADSARGGSDAGRAGLRVHVQPPEDGDVVPMVCETPPGRHGRSAQAQRAGGSSLLFGLGGLGGGTGSGAWTGDEGAECHTPPPGYNSRSSTGSGQCVPVEWGGTEYWARLWDSIEELREQATQRQQREAWLMADAYWRQRLARRGHCFFTLICEWVTLVRSMGTLVEPVPWDLIPGYDRLVRAFLLEMRRRPVTQWPESMQCAALALLGNEKLAQPFIAITLRRMNAHKPQSVSAALDLVSSWLFTLHERGSSLPASFDYDLVIKRVRLLLASDHFKILTWTLIFLHNHLHMFSEEARSTLLMWLSGEGHFERLLLHWCHHVRSVFLHLVVFKVIKRGQHTIGFFPPNGAGVVPLMLASLYARRIEQVQQHHIDLQRKSAADAGARLARGGAPGAGVHPARPVSPPLGAERLDGSRAMCATNPTLCYALSAFKQLADLMAKFDQFIEESKDSQVDRTESHFLPMRVLRDELPDESFEGALDDW